MKPAYINLIAAVSQSFFRSSRDVALTLPGDRVRKKTFFMQTQTKESSDE